jgi:hypothetical protein
VRFARLPIQPNGRAVTISPHTVDAWATSIAIALTLIVMQR